MYEESKLKTIAYKLTAVLPDKWFLSLKYYKNFARFPNWNNPKTFNEKLLWLKVYNHDPRLTRLVDKYAVKEYVAVRIGKDYVIPTIGVWDSAENIDFDQLPNQFVLKATHDSGRVVICKDKHTLDKELARFEMKKSLERDFYLATREWPSKNVPRRIIAEPYLEDEETKELRDYKFFCFNGKVKAMFIATDRQKREEPYFDFFDTEYNHLNLKQGHPNSPVPPQKPKCFEEMKCLATKLSEGMPHVRVDFYEVNGKVYFGELTFFHFSGTVPFEPEKWDFEFGSWILLPKE